MILRSDLIHRQSMVDVVYCNGVLAILKYQNIPRFCADSSMLFPCIIYCELPLLSDSCVMLVTNQKKRFRSLINERFTVLCSFP